MIELIVALRLGISRARAPIGMRLRSLDNLLGTQCSARRVTRRNRRTRGRRARRHGNRNHKLGNKLPSPNRHDGVPTSTPTPTSAQSVTTMWRNSCQAGACHI